MVVDILKHGLSELKEIQEERDWLNNPRSIIKFKEELIEIYNIEKRKNFDKVIDEYLNDHIGSYYKENQDLFIEKVNGITMEDINNIIRIKLPRERN